MKKGIIAVSLVIGCFSGAAFTADLNVGLACAASFTPQQPSEDKYPHQFSDNLRKLMENDPVYCDNYAKIDNPDGWWWNFPNERDGKYAYMIFKFVKPTGYTSGTCRWKVNADSNQTVYISYYYYNTTLKKWLWDIVDQYTGPMSGYRSFTVPAGWFSGENLLWIMADAITVEGARAIKCDVLDIQY